MNKLPKEKRDQLMLVSMGTLFLLILIVFGLIRPQYDNISAINAKISAARKDLQYKEDTIKKADTVSTQLADLTYPPSQAEGDMVSGDPALPADHYRDRFLRHGNRPVPAPRIG